MVGHCEAKIPKVPPGFRDRCWMMMLSAGRIAVFEKQGKDGSINWRDPAKIRASIPGEASIDNWIDASYPPEGASPAQSSTAFSRDFRFLDLAGNPCWFEVQGQTTFDSENGRTCLIGILLDVTDRKRAEERLQCAQTALREINRKTDEFIGRLAHELRNPLSPILTSAQLLQRHGRERPELLEPATTSIERQVKHLSRMIGELSDFARIGRGKLQLAVEVVELGGLIDGVVEILGPTLETRRQDCSMILPERPLRVWADPARLAQVIQQLLCNASKFTPTGGCIGLTVSVEEDHVAITVRDNGVGIEPARLGSIFEPFAQAEQSLHGGPRGLGLGLALAKRLLDLQGGSIAVASGGAGQGSEFVVRLPLA